MKKILLLVLLLFAASILQAQQSLIELPGKIAYIGSDYNVYTLTLHNENIHTLTSDATIRQRYQWPTWARDGRLAYFCCDSTASSSFAIDIWISQDGESSGELAYSGENQVFTYANWSPSRCISDTDCAQLGVLVGQRSFGGFSVELIRTDEDGEFDNTRMGIGQPFYFSWSPDGQQVLTQRNNRRLDIYDLDSGEFERLSQRPGSIQAPAWSPVDDRLLVGIRNDTTFRTDLVILADSKTTTLREEIPGLISFNWSPDGNYIAFRTVNDNQISPVTVIDSISGEVVAQSNMNNVYAFFWSPDSQLIAMATIATPSGSFNARDNVVLASSAAAQQSPELAWAVLDIELDATRRYGAFQPTSDMIYMFNFFDQFAQSHQIWSPDSTHIVFSEINDQGTPTISILDMTRPDTVPFFIAEGYVGIWSYD